MSETPLTLLGIGNPLLDISAKVEPAFLEKYGLQLNNAILAEEKHQSIYADLIEHYPVEYIAGGATQNSIRVAQWMINTASSHTVYLGSVGKDQYAQRLKEEAKKDNVQVAYYEQDKLPTGTCAVLVIDSERSLVANLSAANAYQESHLLSEAVQQLVAQSQIFYSAGFFLTVSPPSLMHLAEHSLANKKVFAGNLSAPFIPQFFAAPLLAALEYYDFLFGNESEAEAFAKAQNYEDLAIPAIAARIAALPYKGSALGRSRYVVITQGAKSTVVSHNGKTEEFAVPPVPQEKIVDVNGAGDAFVGGFLSVLQRTGYDKFDVAKAVEAGHYASSKIIQVSGCVLSGKPDFSL